MTGIMRRIAVIAALGGCVACGAFPAAAAEKVTVGIVGGLNAFVWPFAIAMAKGYYTERGIEPDVIYVPSSPGMLQQLAAGSLDIAGSAGLVDPIRLVSRKAGVALGRIELKVSPYVLVAKSQIQGIKDLKGKAVAIGSRADITFILIEKMLAPSGLSTDDVELMYSGSTVSRFAALKAGAFDAAFLAPPLNFIAEGAGFRSLGVAGDYATDLPFTGSIVNRTWALAHLDTARNFLGAEDQAVEWLYDEANRTAAIQILIDASHSNADDAARSYDFLRDGDYFDRTHKVSRRGVAALVSALREFGDKDVSLTPEDTVVPGLTELSE